VLAFLGTWARVAVPGGLLCVAAVVLANTGHVVSGALALVLAVAYLLAGRATRPTRRSRPSSD
jgi:hypothetical protein